MSILKKIALTLFFITLMVPNTSIANEVQIIETNANVDAWLIESHTVPIITARITFKKSGSAYDPQDHSGLAYFTSNLMDEGAGKLSGKDFKNKMSELATRYSFSADKDNFYITFKTITKNFEESFELISLAIREPLFDQEAINRNKQQTLISIQKQEENPSYVANRAWEEIVFKNHPYSRPLIGTRESVENMTKINIQDFAKKHFAKDRLVLSFVGDIKAHKIKKYVNKYLSNLPATGKVTEIQKFTNFPKRKVHQVEKPLPQSVVVFGQRGVPIDSEDFYPLHLFNYVMGGGGFESRLMEEMREKNGLVYSVYSYLKHQSKAPILEGQFATKHESIDRAIEVFDKEIHNLKNVGITKQELEAAKSYALGSFPLKLDSYEKLVNYLNFMQVKNLGPDFLKTRNDRVNAVSFEDIERVRNKIFSPEEMTIVVVGKK